MADLQGRKVFKVFNQDFIVDERYNVTKELGQGAYGIVWSAKHHLAAAEDEVELPAKEEVTGECMLTRESIVLRPIISLAKESLSRK